MLPVLADFDADGLRDVIARKMAAIYAADMAPALENVAGVLVASSQERINATRTDPAGNHWAPWSPAYAKVTKSRSLLYGAGALMRSIDAFVMGTDEIHLFAETPYAARQQWGGGGIPSREYLGMSEADSLQASEVIGDHFIALFEAA